MQIDIRRSRDFWAGLMLIGIGAGSMFVARDYAFGTSLRMGPGYFPSVLGGVLILFGLVLLVRGWRIRERLEPGWSPRALIILPFAFVLFGALIERTGFVPALLGAHRCRRGREPRVRALARSSSLLCSSR